MAYRDFEDSAHARAEALQQELNDRKKEDREERGEAMKEWWKKYSRAFRSTAMAIGAGVVLIVAIGGISSSCGRCDERYAMRRSFLEQTLEPGQAINAHMVDCQSAMYRFHLEETSRVLLTASARVTTFSGGGGISPRIIKLFRAGEESPITTLDFLFNQNGTRSTTNLAARLPPGDYVVVVREHQCNDHAACANGYDGAFRLTYDTL